MNGQPVEFRDYLAFWGRWMGLLPAALLAVVLVHFPVHWGVLILKAFSKEDSFPWGWFSARTLESLGIALFAPMVFIACGSWVAPRSKVHVAMILLILWIFILAATVIFLVTLSDDYHFNWLQLTAASGLSMAGALWGATNAHRKYETSKVAF